MMESFAQVDAAPSPLAESVSLQRNFLWTLAGNLLYAACQWGMLVAIAKLGTPTMLGQFALGLAVSAPVFMLTNLQLRVVLATDVRHEYRLGHYLALRILGTAVALILIAGFVFLAGFRRETVTVVLFVSLAKAIETFSDIIYAFWQKYEHFDEIAIALAGRGVGSLAATAAVLFLTRNIALATAAMALVWALWLASYERNVARSSLAAVSFEERLRPAWDIEKSAQLVVLAWPLGIVMLLLSLNANIPRYFVQHFWGETSLGYFAAMAYAFAAGNTVITAMGQSAAPRLARYFNSDRRAFARLLRNMVSLGAVLGIVGIALALFYGRAFLRLLYRPDYAEYTSLFVWLMVAAAFAYVASMLGYGLTAARLFRPQVPLSLVALVITTVSCWFLIPRLGLIGSAYAVLVGAVFSCASSAYIIFAALHSETLGVEA